MEDENILKAALLRQSAEKLFGSRPLRSGLPLTPAETLSLIHELEVHQIELEMQNDELEAHQNEIQTQKELVDTTLEDYTQLYDFVPSGYFSLNRDGEILIINQHAAKLLGKDQAALVGSRLGFFLTDDSKHILSNFLDQLFSDNIKAACELVLLTDDKSTVYLHITGIHTKNNELCYFSALDITARRLGEKYREMTREILQILNEPGAIRDSIHPTLTLLKSYTGFDAIGIRLKDNNDYPYLDQTGFSNEFMLTENTLQEFDNQGQLCRDKNGKPRLGCTCGLVIDGKPDTTDPFFTAGGSWWTNDSLPLLGLPVIEDARFQSRNICIHQGYASIALVPIRNNSETVGLIQFNDKRKNRFSKNTIEILEGIASHIGAAMMRKQAEELLRKNEELLRTITENAPDVIVELDRGGTILYMSRVMTGYKMEDVVGKNFVEWSMPEYHTEMMAALELIFSEGLPQKFESRGYGDNGEIKWYRSSLSPVKEEGVVKYAVMIARDITESIQAEKALKESNEKRNAIILSAMDGFWITNLNGSILEVNETLCSMCGYSREELLTMKVHDLEANESSEDTAAHIHELLTKGQDRFETKHRSKDGTIYDVEISVRYKESDGGKFVAFLHNISKRKKREVILRQSEERYKSLFNDNYSVMLLIQPETGTILDANPAACTYYGWSKQEICSKNISEINLLTQHEVAYEMQKAKDEERNHFFFKHRLASGDIRDVEVYSGSIQFGETTMLYSIVHDITDRIRAEARLVESEGRYKSMFQDNQSILMLIDPETGEIKDANPAACAYYGWSHAELCKKYISEINPMSKEEISKNLINSREYKNNHLFFKHRLASGELRDVEVYSGPITFGESMLIYTIVHDITETKLAEEALIVSERRMDAVFNGVTETIILMDIEGKILMANRTAASRWGMSIDDLIGYNGFEYVHPELKIKRTNQIREMIETRSPIRFEESNKGIVYDLTFYPIIEPSGEINQFIIFNRDITEQKKAEQALLESEEKFRKLVYDMEVGILLNGPQSEIILANPKALELLGLTEDQITGKTPFDDDWQAIHEDGTPFPGDTHPAAQVIATGKAVKNVVMGIYQPLRGEHTWFLISAQPQLDENGALLQVVTTFVEISELKEAQRELKENELRLKYHFENSPLGVVEWDNNFVVTQWSFEAERIFGWTKEETLGKPVGELNLIYEKDIPIVNHTMQRLTNGKEDTVVSSNRNITKLGDIITAVWYNSILLDEKGNMKSVMSLVQDITAQKKAEEALVESEILFRESQQAAFIGSYKTNFKTGLWESSEVMDQIFGIDNTYIKSVEGWLHITHPNDREMMNTYLYEEVVGKGLPFDKEYRIIRQNDGELRWIHGLGKVEFDAEHTITSLVGTIQDVTERKAKEEALQRLNRTLAALSKSSQFMSQSNNEAEYLNKVCNIVVEDTDFAMVWIGFAEEDEAKSIRPVASAGFNDNYLDSVKISWGDNEFGRGPSGVAIRTGKISLCNNMLTDPNFEPWREEALKRGYSSSIVFPLKSGDKTFGAFTIYSKEPDSFLEDEIKLLSKLANDLAHGIITIRLREAHHAAELALQKSHDQLEMQVKERTLELELKNEAIKVNEEKYRTVADFAANWEFWLDPDDIMLYCSPSCERITGYAQDDFIFNSKLMVEIIHPDDLPEFELHKETETFAHICDHEIQYRIIRKDGQIRWIGHYCQPIFDAEGVFKGTRGSNKDITARKKMEALLTTSNQKYKLLSENITDGIFICNVGRFEYVNKAVCTILGYERKELEGMKLTQLVISTDNDQLEDILYSNKSFNCNFNVEVQCFKKDLSPVFVEILLNYVAKEKMVYGVIHDITEKKQIQKNILKAIIETEEAEKAHFSKELHDGLGPLLSTIKLYLQWSERSKTDESRIEIIHRAEEIVEDALSTVKEISTKLSPHLLTYYGLNAAIKSFVGKLKNSSEINILFESNFNERLAAEIEASLYRALIECVNNSLKYSKAHNIEIFIHRSNSQLQINYRDNGIGFDLKETLAKHKGLGLFNLQNRIENIGGKLTLYSTPGFGVDYQFVINID